LKVNHPSLNRVLALNSVPEALNIDNIVVLCVYHQVGACMRICWHPPACVHAGLRSTVAVGTGTTVRCTTAACYGLLRCCPAGGGRREILDDT
jgi:hypothetical protein